MDFYSENSTWVAVDTETGGLNPWLHDLLEIGAVRFLLEGEIVERFQVLLKPKNKQDPRARAVHNISNEELEKDAIEPEEGLRQFYNFIREDPVVFHNAPFDISFLTRAFQKNKMELPKNYYYDNLYLSKKYFKERKSHSLISIREILSIDTGKAHRALSDAEATALSFIHIIQTKVGKTSKTKLRDFLRYHRRLDEFEIKLPKEFSKIEEYFRGHIRRGTLIKLRYNDKWGRVVTQVIIPKDFMIFNQKFFLKGIAISNQQESLFPITGSTVIDPEKGFLKF